MLQVIEGQQVVNFCSLYLQGIAFKPHHAIGFTINGHIVGGVVFDNYTIDAKGRPMAMEASVVVIDKRCINRYTLGKLFCYPFGDLKVKRLCIRCGRSERQKRHLVERMGFRLEGIAREAWPFGGSAAVYSMLKHECKWLNHGKLSLSSGRSKPISHRSSPDRQQPANGALSSGA